MAQSHGQFSWQMDGRVDTTQNVLKCRQSRDGRDDRKQKDIHKIPQRLSQAEGRGVCQWLTGNGMCARDSAVAGGVSGQERLGTTAQAVSTGS